jgi:hypothetical protein
MHGAVAMSGDFFFSFSSLASFITIGIRCWKGDEFLVHFSATCSFDEEAIAS